MVRCFVFLTKFFIAFFLHTCEVTTNENVKIEIQIFDRREHVLEFPYNFAIKSLIKQLHMIMAALYLITSLKCLHFSDHFLIIHE